MTPWMQGNLSDLFTQELWSHFGVVRLGKKAQEGQELRLMTTVSRQLRLSKPTGEHGTGGHSLPATCEANLQNWLGGARLC